MTPFRYFCSSLSLNYPFLKRIISDTLCQFDTCYTQVSKIPYGHYVEVSQSHFTVKCYYTLQNVVPKKASFENREACYAAFRTHFQSAVQQYMPDDQIISMHISGGLDSTSVACMAASLSKDRPLYGFTAVPHGLEGQSRTGWKYHDMDIIDSVLQLYPWIKHYPYYSQTKTNIAEYLLQIYPLSDQPIRNFFNLDWMIGSFEFSKQVGSRILLVGSLGNSTISWRGMSIYQRCRALLFYWTFIFRPFKIIRILGPLFKKRFAFSAFFLLLRRSIKTDLRSFLISSPYIFSRMSSIYSTQLWFGVMKADPTADIRLLEFCYSVPQHYYFDFKRSLTPALQHRLLVRESLVGIVPEMVRNNPNRGEQGADWILQFNAHCREWLTCIRSAMSRFPFLHQIYNLSRLEEAFSPIQEDLPWASYPSNAAMGIALSMSLFLTSIYKEDHPSLD